MASDHSFDIVSKPNLAEIENALHTAQKELLTRFDFKGSISKIEKEAENIRLISEDEYKLKNVLGIIQDKLIKRKVPIKFFEVGSVEQTPGGTVKQLLTLKQGIPQEKAKEIVKMIKALGLKLQASIQGDQIRVSSKKIDALQTTMQHLKAANFSIVLQFDNYR